MFPIPTPTQINSEYTLTIEGFESPFGDPVEIAIFKVIEDVSSRAIEPGSSVVYDVVLDPPSDTQWINDIHLSLNKKWENSTISEELIIAANVYRYAGWVHMADQTVKKWPPRCVRNGPNSFRVTIDYAPLAVVNFQISPQKTKKKVAIDTLVWENNDGTFQQVNMNAITPEQYIAYNNINVDRKGIVQGVDVFDPSFSWTERWTYGPVLDPQDYHKFVTQLSGTVNLNKFRGFDPESVLLISAVGRNIFPLTWEYDYSFSYAPPRGAYFEIGDGTSGIWIHPSFRSGHVHVDMEEQEHKEGRTQGDIITLPKSIKLHKIYPTYDFDFLSVAPGIPFGYGTPLDGKYDLKSKFVETGTVPYIGLEWALPEWGDLS